MFSAQQSAAMILPKTWIPDRVFTPLEICFGQGAETVEVCWMFTIRHLLVILIQAVIFGASAVLAAPAPKQHTRLTARVTHSEVLPPLPGWLRPGQTYTPGSLPSRFALQTRQFFIPDWLAGTWLRESAREVSRQQLPGGAKLAPAGQVTARVQDKFGTYADAQGLVWQTFNPARSLGSVDHGNNVDYHQVTAYDLSVEPDDSVIVRVLAVHTVVSKSTGKIVTTYQDEEINTYRQVADGKLETDSSVKVFDLKGRPFLLTRSLSSERRIKRFEGR
jgi:hypothetical protein